MKISSFTEIQTLQAKKDENFANYFFKAKLKRSGDSDVTTFRKRCFKKFNSVAFNADLKEYPWEKLCGAKSVHQAAELHDKMINECLDIHAPWKTIRIRKRKVKKIELEPETLRLLRSRDEMKKKITSGDSSPSTAEQFKKVRNQCKAAVKRERTKSVIENLQKDPSVANVWRITKDILKPKSEAPKLKLKVGNDLLESEDAVAAAFIALSTSVALEIGAFANT